MYNEQIFNNVQKHIDLSESEKSYFSSLLASKKIKKNEYVLKQSQICRKLVFVESGSLRAFNNNEAGKESTIMFAVKDWWITDMHAFINQKPALFSIVALEDTIITELTYTDLNTLYESIPKFEKFFRILFQNAYIREQHRALNNISLTTEARYLKFIEKYPDIVKKVTQKQIASYLGVTPEFLSTIKKK